MLFRQQPVATAFSATIALHISDRLNKKLSYRRHSACQRSLRSSRSFNVTDVCTNRKPICDVLL